MTMFKRHMLTVLLAALTVAGLVSCKSREYYKEQAVEDARAFALDNLRDLTPIQRNFIRYNKPDLYAETYMGRDFFTETKPVGGNDFCQMCAVWRVPGDKIPIIVFGPSDHGIRGWTPTRVVRRQFRTKDVARESAIKNAMLYTMNNLLFLQDSDRNRVRFSPPEVFITDFPLDVQGRNKNLQEAVKDARTQVSFVWPSDEGGKKIVVSGMCGPDFEGFMTVTGLLRTPEELKSHTVTGDITAHMTKLREEREKELKLQEEEEQRKRREEEGQDSNPAPAATTGKGDAK